MKEISGKRLDEFNHPDFATRLKAGEELAYRELVNSFIPWAKNFVRKKYRLPKEDAKDILQSFSQRIVEKIDTFDSEQGQFIGWAFQILRNLTIDWLRPHKKLGLISIDSSDFEAPLSFAVVDDMITSPNDDLSALEKLPVEVRQAFLKLNNRYQQFLGLMLLGTSNQAIQEVMGIASAGALWTLRSRALAKLKEEVEKIGSIKRGQS
ncbi:MAG: RNA polymerase sigma factor [bacterium]